MKSPDIKKKIDEHREIIDKISSEIQDLQIESKHKRAIDGVVTIRQDLSPFWNFVCTFGPLFLSGFAFAISLFTLIQNNAFQEFARQHQSEIIKQQKLAALPLVHSEIIMHKGRQEFAVVNSGPGPAKVTKFETVWEGNAIDDRMHHVINTWIQDFVNEDDKKSLILRVFGYTVPTMSSNNHDYIGSGVRIKIFHVISDRYNNLKNEDKAMVDDIFQYIMSQKLDIKIETCSMYGDNCREINLVN